jgi:hypothetical protein
MKREKFYSLDICHCTLSNKSTLTKSILAKNKGASLFDQTVWEKEKVFITLTFCHNGGG